MSQRLTSTQSESKSHAVPQFYCAFTLFHQSFYKILRKDKSILADFILKMAQALETLQNVGMVHSDIKPDNILIKMEARKIESLKLVDFGSSFSYDEINVTANTLEYLAPELIHY